MDNNDKIGTPIICPYCGVGCNIELIVRNNKAEKVVVNGRNQDVNGRFICVKGLTVAEVLNSLDRLKSPLIKENGSFKEKGWKETLNYASLKLKRIIGTYGPNSIGVLVSGKITNEEAYIAQKFARTVIGTHNIDTCARLCHSPSEVGLRMSLGFGAVSACLSDFAITDVIILIGANTKSTHPGAWNILSKRKEKSKLIVADIFEVISSADISLTPKPGTDLIWICGLSKIIVDKGLYDRNFVDTRTIGFENFKKSLDQYTKDYVEQMTSISYDKLEQVAELITHNKTMFVWGMGLTQNAHGTDAVLSISNLALLTGNIGKVGTGVVPLRGQNNVQGAVDMGCAPFTLPGSYDLSDKGALSHFEGFWSVKLSETTGLSATEMIHHILDGKIKALYIIGENPVLSEPQSGFVRWMLQSLDLLIVQDIFLTETVKFAQVVFPAAALGEKEGTATNADRRIQYSEKAVNPPGLAKPDWEIIQLLSSEMGINWNYSCSEDIWNEIRQIAPIFRGAAYARLRNSNGLFWPIYNEQHIGTQRLYTELFAFKDNRARFFPIHPPVTITKTTEEYPFMLVTHRLYEHFNTGVMTLKSSLTTRKLKTGFVAMNEEDVKDLKLNDNSSIRINSPYGSLETKVKIIKQMNVPRNYLFAPIHFFHDGNFNQLTSTYPLDPLAKMPSLKKIPVNIDVLNK